MMAVYFYWEMLGNHILFSNNLAVKLHLKIYLPICAEPLAADSQFMVMLPKGALSVLLQPTYGARDPNGDGGGAVEGFILLASNARYAYRESDRAWIKVIANKFQGMNDACRSAVSAEISS